jgi:hypothetical protein
LQYRTPQRRKDCDDELDSEREPLLGGSSKALATNGRQRLNPGDVAILQLLAAAELIEADLCQQYKELGRVDAPDSGYKAGLVILHGD